MKAPAFQFYARDFLVGTAMMSAEEVGAYIRLLCYQWDNGSLPNDDAVLARLGGCSGNAVASIRHKFGIDPAGNLVNARLEKTRRQQREYSEKQAKKARTRWGTGEMHEKTCNGNAAAYTTAQPRECSASATASATPTDNTIPCGGRAGRELPAKEPLQLRAEALIRRRPATPMSAAEQRAWKSAKAVVADTDEDSWRLLEWWFSLPDSEAPFRKTDFAAVLNNWHAEIAKAARNKSSGSQQALISEEFRKF